MLLTRHLGRLIPYLPFEARFPGPPDPLSVCFHNVYIFPKYSLCHGKHTHSELCTFAFDSSPLMELLPLSKFICHETNMNVSSPVMKLLPYTFVCHETNMKLRSSVMKLLPYKFVCHETNMETSSSVMKLLPNK